MICVCKDDSNSGIINHIDRNIFYTCLNRVASLDEGTLTAEFESPQFAPAPGQRLALYGGEVLAASGVIV